MNYMVEYQQKFLDLMVHIENQDQLCSKSNGGNSILFTYPPEEDQRYTDKAKEYFASKAAFIDVSKLLVKFIEKDGWDAFKEYYKDFQNTPHLVFHSDDPSKDLFDMIIDEIQKACVDDKIPFLIRTGCLLGTGIENVNIMENKVIMTLSHPLVIFYPSKVVDDNIYFLNFKHASKYRCLVV